jgi:hypothetical protein
LHKLAHYITNSTDDDDKNIDGLHGDKHGYAVTQITDRLVAEFGSKFVIKTSYYIVSGKLDMVLFLKTSESKTIIIGIEVKTRKHLDLAQIERYIFVCDFLVVAQLLQRVHLFSTDTFADNLLGSAATSYGPNLSGSAGGDLALCTDFEGSISIEIRGACSITNY